jgi:CheY-like chemotaxis protein
VITLIQHTFSDNELRMNMHGQHLHGRSNRGSRSTESKQDAVRRILAVSSAPILVVEDNADMRNVIILILENAGWSVIGVSNGREAVEYLRRGQVPAAIVLDLKMPSMDGATFRSILLAKEEWAGIPVLVCTGVSENDTDWTLSSVAVWLQKPFSSNALVAAVKPYRQVC